MANWADVYGGTTFTSLQDAASVRTTASVKSDYFDLRPYEGEMAAILYSTIATAGALSVRLETTAATSGGWAVASPALTFTVAAATDTNCATLQISAKRYPRFLRSRAVATGTGAHYRISVAIAGRPKYV